MAAENPGLLFASRYGPVCSLDNLLAYVGFLRQESGVATQPPIDLQRVYSRFGIEPKKVPLADIQGMLLDAERGLILINSDDIPTRQRFTEAHEIMEFCFDTRALGAGGKRTIPVSEKIKEQWCDAAAAELLMPQGAFLRRVTQEGVSSSSGARLAREYGVSLTAVLCRMVRLGPGRHALVMWCMKNKPSEVRFLPSPGQMSFLADAPYLGPRPRLRVGWALCSPDVPLVPAHKSVSEDSLIYAAWQDGHMTAGQEFLNLATTQGMFQSENLPFMVGEDRRVLSLLHLPGDRE